MAHIQSCAAYMHDLSTKWFRHLLFASNLRPAQKRSACLLWAQSFRWWSRDETLKVINVFA